VNGGLNNSGLSSSVYRCKKRGVRMSYTRNIVSSELGSALHVSDHVKCQKTARFDAPKPSTMDEVAKVIGRMHCECLSWVQRTSLINHSSRIARIGDSICFSIKKMRDRIDVQIRAFLCLTNGSRSLQPPHHAVRGEVLSNRYTLLILMLREGPYNQSNDRSCSKRDRDAR
jgi:hypothetical protein